ncbi:O-antigen ligase family protein [Falsiroseomonas sp. HW251]|uniref:O-antigen ligase family protein n=1 Tax=Falsiroseomonas sp. HW251 TaxID=3390998 RepID=UPI003D3167DA
MPRDILLALGLALSTATQLRISGTPLGVAELLLGTWMFVGLTAHLATGSRTVNAVTARVLAFWAMIVLGLSVGLISGFARELFQDMPAMLHDVFAYLLMGALGIALSLELGDARRRRCAFWLFTASGAALLLVQLATPGGGLWYYNRFRGWSENPNQLGFSVSVLTFVALHLAHTAGSVAERVGALACAGVAILAGILSRSDSFTVALLTGSAVWVALTGVNWFQTLRSGLMLRGAAVLLALLSVPLFAAAFAPFASATLERIEQTSDRLYNDNDQGDTRLNLWREALQRGVSSGFIGLGPGPQLTSKSYKRPPPDKFEAHNTFLDLFTQGGLLAVGAFAWLWLVAFRGAWRAGFCGIAALLCALITFSMFHLIVRQPVFWFGVVCCLLESARVLHSAGSDRQAFSEATS